MTRRAIVLWPDPVLAAPCAPVPGITPEIERLAHDLLDTMYAAPGRGLAAPQVGVPLRVFVMDTDWKDGTPAPQVFVNPEIVARSTTTVTRGEGCLSIPGITAEVTRPETVQMRWTGLDGALCDAAFAGFAAACVQHELDHLDGIVTLDRVEPEDRARLVAAYEEAAR